MSRLPPSVTEAEFLAVESADGDVLKQRFNKFVRSLHAYLNQLPCLHDIQKARCQWTRPRESDAFGNFVADPSHWYTFHHGGRNEAQFNLSLSPSLLRVGLGFEFTEKEFGDPTLVGLAYTYFRHVITTQRTRFERFVAENRLEIQWSLYEVEMGSRAGSLEYVATDDVVTWLLDSRENFGWVFVGRLLRRNRDAAQLADAEALGTVMRTVLCGFRPYWEETMLLTRG